MISNAKMVGKNILVRDIKDQQKTENGIIVQTDFEPKTIKGEVLAVSSNPECQIVSVGDTVYYHKFAGMKIKEDGNLYRIMPIADAIAKEV